jgi:hypothetical protein
MCEYGSHNRRREREICFARSALTPSRCPPVTPPLNLPYGQESSTASAVQYCYCVIGVLFFEARLSATEVAGIAAATFAIVVLGRVAE